MPVEIVWSRMARARLEEIRAYVAKDKPEAAARLATRIVAVVEALDFILIWAVREQNAESAN